MMPFSVRLLTSLLPVVVGLSACAQIDTTPVSKDAADAATQASADADKPVVNSPLDAQLMYGILLGELNFQQGDAGDGTGYMLEAARISGQEALYERAATMAVQAQSADLALQVTEAWREAEPESLAALRFELQVLLATGQLAATEQPLQELMATLPDDEKLSLITAMPAFYEGAPAPDEATQVVEQVLADATEDPDLAAAAWTTVGRMRLRAGDAAGALAAARLGHEADPQAQWPAILALQLVADGPDETQESAQAVVKDYLAQPQADASVRLGYAQLLLETARYDEAAEQLDHSTRDDPDNAQAWLLKGILAEDMRRDDDASQALQRYLELAIDADGNTVDGTASGPDRARLALARVAARQGDEAQAMRWLDAVESDDQALQAALQKADLLARQGDLEAGRAVIRQVPDHDADDARLKTMAEARLLREHGQPQQAYDLLAQALQASPDDEDLLYDTAMAAERLDDLPTMERLLRQLTDLNPDAAHAYNALGYSLADRGLRLDEAQALIEKAVSLAPDDGYVRDSLGWVYYKQGQLEQARATLQAAYDQQPDAEIAAHLGEVLWHMGQHDAARDAWAKGQQLDPDNPALVDTMKRLDP